MKKIIQINSVVNTGSTGRIAEGIGEVFLQNKWESTIAYGRYAKSSKSKLIRIGNSIDNKIHAIYTRFYDRHCFSSKKTTVDLVKTIEKIKPNLIVLHNLHGYYLHIEVLFDYLKKVSIPVFWTLHDCWAFTGHCVYFDYAGCNKWKTHCSNCPQIHRYPRSFIKDNSFQNFDDKRNIFTGHRNLTIVTPSKWLKNLVNQSFLKEYPVQVINNGIDLTQFKILPHSRNELRQLKKKKVILGVASIWEDRKGLDDFVQLNEILNDGYQIALIGLTKKQKTQLPDGILGIPRTENIEELSLWYNRADVFLNPTYEDNFPTTNLEALACGTPIVTYNTGGSSEAIDQNTGIVVPKGDIQMLKNATEEIVLKRFDFTAACRRRAEELYNQNERFEDYMNLYKAISIVRV